MKLLTFDRPHVLSRLSDELLTAIPALQPVDGRAVAVVRGDGATFEVRVPDSVSAADVQAVVEAHDPTPAPPPPDPDEELAEAIEAATTLPELKDALLGRSRAGRAAGRPT